MRYLDRFFLLISNYLFPSKTVQIELEYFIAFLCDFFQASKQEYLITMQVQTVTTPWFRDLAFLLDQAPSIALDIELPHVVQGVISFSQSSKHV